MNSLVGEALLIGTRIKNRTTADIGSQALRKTPSKAYFIKTIQIVYHQQL